MSTEGFGSAHLNGPFRYQQCDVLWCGVERGRVHCAFCVCVGGRPAVPLGVMMRECDVVNSGVCSNA